MEKLKFQKMWEAADTFVFDIDTGSILPIVDALSKVASFADKHWFYYYENGIGAAYYEEGEMKKAAEAGLKDFSDKEYRKTYFSDIKTLLESETKLYQKIEEIDFSKISNTELKDYLQQSVDIVVKNFGYYLACQPQCVSLIEKRVQRKLSRVVSENKIIDAFTLLSTATTSTKIRREEQDWLNLIIKFKKENLSDDDHKELIFKHYKEYFLLNAADGHEPWTLEYFSNKFLNDNKLPLANFENRLSEIEKSSKKIEKQKTVFIEEHNIKSDIIDDCNLLAEIGHWRLEMRFVWMPGYYYDKRILSEVAKRFSSNQTLIRFARISEIMTLFEGASLNNIELKNRNKAFLFAIENEKVFVVSGAEAQKKLVEYAPPVDNSGIREFKGNIAMNGKVKAKVLVYKWGDNMQEKLSLVRGEFILVAGQTRPQLMPLIVKSSGIVTDEGGITSHAAIVSRELGIPCVIGTKIATQILNDGDLVEVDANIGIIKIVKKFDE